jgi:hypothetical protein
MTNDFETKLADLVWTLIEPKIDQKLANFRDDLGTFDGDLDEKISDWMSGNFRLDDYSFELDGMIDQQVQYLAEDGDLKEWLDQEHEQFEEKVLNVLRTNTIRIEI